MSTNNRRFWGKGDSNSWLPTAKAFGASCYGLDVLAGKPWYVLKNPKVCHIFPNKYSSIWGNTSKMMCIVGILVYSIVYHIHPYPAFSDTLIFDRARKFPLEWIRNDKTVASFMGMPSPFYRRKAQHSSSLVQLWGVSPQPCSSSQVPHCAHSLHLDKWRCSKHLHTKRYN